MRWRDGDPNPRHAGRHKVSRVPGSKVRPCRSVTARNPGPIRSGGIGRKPCRRNQGPFQAGSRNVVSVTAGALTRTARARTSSSSAVPIPLPDASASTEMLSR